MLTYMYFSKTKFVQFACYAAGKKVNAKLIVICTKKISGWLLYPLTPKILTMLCNDSASCYGDLMSL